MENNNQQFYIIRVNPKGNFKPSNYIITREELEKTNLRIIKCIDEKERMLGKMYENLFL